MSDLQCAATFLVLPPAADVPLEQLRAERAACLYAEPGVDATVLAQALGVTARDLDLGGVGDLAGVAGDLSGSAGDETRPAGDQRRPADNETRSAGDQPRPADNEPGPAGDQPQPADSTTPAALTAALVDLADEFRGETVAVVVSEATYARLTGEVLATSAPAAVVEIDADSRRWRPYE